MDRGFFKGWGSIGNNLRHQVRVLAVSLHIAAYNRGIRAKPQLTGMEIDNVTAHADRQELVAKLSNKFWRAYGDYTFKFTDGSDVHPLDRPPIDFRSRDSDLPF